MAELSVKDLFKGRGLDFSHGIKANVRTWIGFPPPYSLRAVLTQLKPPILEMTSFHNQVVDTSSPTWTRDRVGGKTFMSTDGPAWEWTPILDPSNEYDQVLTGLSGLVLHDATASQDNLSTGDNPFLHPFGFDYEILVAPDPAYVGLLAPQMLGAYQIAKDKARQSYNVSVPGVIGVETDQDLVPADFRASEGDRVCVWGRWIIDTGHDDFHTEIHPPLVMVAGRLGAEPVDPSQPGAGSVAATVTRVISRPYLVSQEFDDGALFHHLVDQASQVESFQSTQVDAHPHVMLTPFAGAQLLMYTVRPPSPRQSPQDTLMVAFRFTIRSGVAVQVAPGPATDPDSVLVAIILNDNTYKPPKTLPHKNDWTIKLDELERLDQDAGSIYRTVIFASILNPINPFAAAFLARGILTDRYDPPQVSSPLDSNSTRLAVSALPPNTPVNLDDSDSQPFPVYGSLRLYWN